MPLLVDLAAMRSAVERLGKDPKIIEPLVPVDLVVDHSVQVDFWSTPDALARNMEMEFRRNRARYQFLKWGMQAFHGFEVVPPGIGIVHQVNLEYLAPGVLERDGVWYPDTLVGTDSHTTMINGLGIVGWGVGGIEAEAGMLGQPVYFLTPDVVGVHLTGRLAEGVTATDLVLALHGDAAQGEGRRQVRRVLRRGRGVAVAGRPRDDREHGAGVRRDDGLLPGRRGVLQLPPRDGPDRRSTSTTFRAYFQAQGLFGIPRGGRVRLHARCSSSTSPRSGRAWPGRSGRRTASSCRISRRGSASCSTAPVAENGYGKTDAKLAALRTRDRLRGHGPEAPMSGGGHQTHAEHRIPARSAKDTNPWTETEMVNNRPSPDRVDEVPEEHLPPGMRHARPRRRPDRGDHVLHEHVESERDARGRPAREEGGRARALTSRRR